MKKSLILILALVICVFPLGACQNNQQSSNSNSTSTKPIVYASFYAMYDLTKKVGGDKIELYNMLDKGMEPHDFEPSASDIINLENADVFVYNGANMEHWVDKIKDSLQSTKLICVEASAGVELLSSEQQSDPHVWLSPKNAKIEANNIKNALVKADPSNTASYEKNYTSLSKELDALDKEYSSTISSFSKKDIVVAHRAYSYLCKEYGLNQMAISGLSPDVEPDPASMAKTIDFCKSNNVKTIFFEETASSKVAQVIADELSATVSVLNPLEALSKDELAAGDDYFSIMRKNLVALEGALS